jgi:hypothetical protein
MILLYRDEGRHCALLVMVSPFACLFHPVPLPLFSSTKYRGLFWGFIAIMYFIFALYKTIFNLNKQTISREGKGYEGSSRSVHRARSFAGSGGKRQGQGPPGRFVPLTLPPFFRPFCVAGDGRRCLRRGLKTEIARGIHMYSYWYIKMPVDNLKGIVYNTNRTA